jgi:hypothetical protein
VTESALTLEQAAESVAPTRSENPMLRYQARKRISSGAILAPRELETIVGDRVSIPDARHLIHLQLRRFAGCPVCNLHLQSVVRRHESIVAVGIREIVVFHSSVQELRTHAAELQLRIRKRVCTSSSELKPLIAPCSIRVSGCRLCEECCAVCGRSSARGNTSPALTHRVGGTDYPRSF